MRWFLLIPIMAGLAASARAATLEVAASADLVGLDPMGPGATGTYIHGMLVYDTLFAQTEALQIRPQMVGRTRMSRRTS